MLVENILEEVQLFDVDVVSLSQDNLVCNKYIKINNISAVFKSPLNLYLRVIYPIQIRYWIDN